RAEPSEPLIADLRAKPVLSGMPRAGVVHRDPGRCFQSRAQNILGFGDEPRVVLVQQADQLPLRDRNPHRSQKRQQPGHRRLTLVVLHQHEAAQFRSEMAFDPLRQGSQHRPAVRHYPALAQVTGRLRRNHKILDQKRFVTFENRSCRNLDPDHIFFDFDPRRDLASARLLLLLLGLRWFGAFFHAAWFDVRAALQTFQPSVLFAQFGDGLLQTGYLTEKFGQKQFKLCTGQRGKGGGRRHMMQRVDAAESTQGKNEGLPTLLPLLRGYLLSRSNHTLPSAASANRFPDTSMTAIDRTAYPRP